MGVGLLARVQLEQIPEGEDAGQHADGQGYHQTHEEEGEGHEVDSEAEEDEAEHLAEAAADDSMGMRHRSEDPQRERRVGVVVILDVDQRGEAERGAEIEARDDEQQESPAHHEFDHEEEHKERQVDVVALQEMHRLELLAAIRLSYDVTARDKDSKLQWPPKHLRSC